MTETQKFKIRLDKQRKLEVAFEISDSVLAELIEMGIIKKRVERGQDVHGKIGDLKVAYYKLPQLTDEGHEFCMLAIWTDDQKVFQFNWASNGGEIIRFKYGAWMERFAPSLFVN